MKWLMSCLKLISEHITIWVGFFKFPVSIMVVEKSRGIRLAYAFQSYERFEEALHF